MDIVMITMPSLMDVFITNLRYSQQVVIKPGRASEETKAGPDAARSFKDEALPEVKLSWSLRAGTQQDG